MSIEGDRRQVVELERVVEAEELLQEQEVRGRRQSRTTELVEGADRERDGRILSAFERSGLPRSLWSAALLAELRNARDDVAIGAILQDRRKVAEIAGGQAGAQGEPGSEEEAQLALRTALDVSIPLPPEPDKSREPEEWERELAGAIEGDSGGL